MGDRPVTIDRLVAHGGARLQAAGIYEARREAWRIWSDLAGTPSFTGAIFSEQAVPVEQATRYREAVDRRARGEPLPYVTGLAGFRQLTLRSDRRALIPRPETEGLVDFALTHQPRGVAADIGTGTGCIALALAQEGAYDLVVAVERSPWALTLAEENRQQTGLGIELMAGDMTSGLAADTFDLVVSNPPYLTDAEYEHLGDAVRAWEPAAALVGGPDGLEATRALFADARRVVRPEGWLMVELDASRAVASARLAEAAGWSEVVVHDDLYGRARYLLARRSEAQ